MEETPLESNEIQLTSQYRLGVEPRNFVLTRRRQKREGRGKGAQLINEYGYDRTRANFFGTLEGLKNTLIDEEFLTGMSNQDLSKVDNVVEAIDKALIHIDKVKEEVLEHLKDKIDPEIIKVSKRGAKKTEEDSEEDE